jgi:hypothetical protein
MVALRQPGGCVCGGVRYSLKAAPLLAFACHWWVESAIPWAVIPGVRIVAWKDFDYVALGREWAATAPKFG